MLKIRRQAFSVLARMRQGRTLCADFLKTQTDRLSAQLSTQLSSLDFSGRTRP
jgi:hypothetical protein